MLICNKSDVYQQISMIKSPEKQKNVNLEQSVVNEKRANIVVEIEQMF